MKLRRFSALFVIPLLLAATAQLMAEVKDGAATVSPLINSLSIDLTAEADSNRSTDQSNLFSCDENEPIAYIGHGALFDANGNEIQVTPQFINAAQQCYLDILLRQADEQQQTLFEQKQSSLLDGQQWDVCSELYINTLLLEWLVKEVKPADADQLLGKLKLLQQKVTSSNFLMDPSISSDDARPFEVPDDLEDRLSEEGLTGSEGSFTVFSTTLGGAAYLNECRNAGVPTPPDWGTNQWVSRGVLTNEFISADIEAEVFTYQSNDPEGMCIALPRSAGNTAFLLGIICLGKTSSNACFWDNQQNDQQFDIPKGTVVPISQFAGGADLAGGAGGICTGCHAGENPYIIHPNTALGLPNLSGLPLKADNWYKPLVHSSWPQNIGPTTMLNGIQSPGRCTECHTQSGAGGRFPEPSTDIAKYCNILKMSYHGGVSDGIPVRPTMPSGNPGDPNYAPQFAALLSACTNQPVPPCNGSIYIDAAYTGNGSGKETSPFRTIGEAYNHACAGAQLHMKAGMYTEVLHIRKNITLLSDGGTVIIGR